MNSIRKIQSLWIPYLSAVFRNLSAEKNYIWHKGVQVAEMSVAAAAAAAARKRLFRIQYISDIHLEFHDKLNSGSIQPEMFLNPVAPYLALCGDIGFPERPALRVFLEWCSKNYQHVFWVPGNHEFYNFGLLEKHTYVKKIDLCRKVCEPLSNVHFLQKETYFLAEWNLWIAGCTLWSAFSPDQDMRVGFSMNDTRQIYTDEGENAFPSDLRKWHQEEKEWLLEQVDTCERMKFELLVLTHHLPSYDLIHPKYQGHPLDYCFASQLDSHIHSPIVGWLCGHSHSPVQKEINGVPCALNPYGYPMQARGGPDYKEKVLEIKLE
jgi:hypothetical protein